MKEYEKFQKVSTPKKNLSTAHLRLLRDPITKAIDYIETHKFEMDGELYGQLFMHYHEILNIYNNMIDRNTVQAANIDSRTVVQVQPVIDGDQYTMNSWERQFTANNLNVIPEVITPINTFRR